MSIHPSIKYIFFFSIIHVLFQFPPFDSHLNLKLYLYFYIHTYIHTSTHSRRTRSLSSNYLKLSPLIKRNIHKVPLQCMQNKKRVGSSCRRCHHFVRLSILCSLSPSLRLTNFSPTKQEKRNYNVLCLRSKRLEPVHIPLSLSKTRNLSSNPVILIMLRI